MSSCDDKRPVADPTRSLREFGWGFVIVCLGSAWLLRYMGELSISMIPIVFGAAVTLASAKRWLAVAAILLLNPIGMSFAGGLLEYASGRPTLRFVGLPRLESFNIDPQLRCRVSGGGCCISGDEWIPITVHNLAVEFAINTFGLPAGSYDGPYPTREEAEKALPNAESISLERFLGDEIVIGGQIIRLEQSVGQTILDGFGFWIGTSEERLAEHTPNEWKVRLHACEVDNRCVILSIQQSEAEREYICLIDAQRGRPFAYHEVRGMRRHPPVRYDDPPLLAGVMHAVESGDIELMRQLLQQGADVNVRTETGRTPLMRAAQYKRSQMLRFLIDNGADVNLADNGRRTCLYLLNGDDGTICRMLLEAGANVHHHDGRTGSPLMTAAAYARSLEVVRMLVDAGSPLDQVDYQGRTLIKLAEGNKIPGIAESLKRATAQRQD